MIMLMFIYPMLKNNKKHEEHFCKLFFTRNSVSRYKVSMTVCLENKISLRSIVTALNVKSKNPDACKSTNPNCF